VLVVEDDPASRAMLELIVKRRYSVLTAATGAEARTHLAVHGSAIGIVLMDISLKGDEDGLALTRFIRETPALRDMRVIATTAHALPSDRQRCLAGGCDGYLAKPFNTAELFAAMEEGSTAVEDAALEPQGVRPGSAMPPGATDS
jgi:CheY-like chemotaxis protein